MSAWASLAAAVLIGLVTNEFVMRPSGAERVALGALFVLVAVAAYITARWLPHLARRLTALRHTVLALSVSSIAVVASGVAASGPLMFLSTHDVRMLGVVLGLAVLVGLAFSFVVARPLAADLERISSTARRIGSGDLEARTGITRPDEIGDAARAIDWMAETLFEVEASRERDELARRRLLRAIGHDLRTPLAALQAAVEALDDGLVDRDQLFTSMRHDVRALGGLVDDLFLLAQIDSGRLDLQLSGLDLTDLADEALEALRPVAVRKGIDLRLEADHHVEVRGSSDALGRVLRNLIDNAVRHSPSGGRVVVRVSDRDDAMVSVVDDGPGFDTAFKGEAFRGMAISERSGASGGAGLGLVIAAGFVSAHGGRIWADSGPGGRVSFRLPTAFGDAGNPLDSVATKA